MDFFCTDVFDFVERTRLPATDRSRLLGFRYMPVADGGREAHGAIGAHYFLSGEAPARLCPDGDELMQLGPAGRAHGAVPEVVEHEQPDRG